MEWIGCTVCEIFAFKLYCDLETGVRGHSRSSKVTPFDSLYMVSYYHPIVTLCLKCTVFEIWRHIGRKSSKKPTPTLIWHVPLRIGKFLGKFPLRIFWRLIPCQKLESWGYQRCTFHDPAFALLGTIPACDRQTDRQTDGHVAVAKTRYSIYAVARNN